MNRSFLGWIVFLTKEYWPYFLNGMIVTLFITLLGTALGYLFGFLVGIVQSTPISENDTFLKRKVLGFVKLICAAFVEVFRDTPMMVQAMVIHYGLKTSGVNIEAFTSAVLVMFLNTGAYMAETVRGGISSIDKGQMEGGLAMGLSHFRIMIHVVIPQAFRNIIPEMGNLLITNLKMTSVLNVIGVSELYFATKTAANTYYRYFEAYFIIGMIYFVLCFVLSRILRVLEERILREPSYELAEEYMEGGMLDVRESESAV